MKLLNTSLIEIKKSKFIGLLYEINSKKEAESVLNDLKIAHKKAKHFPYAYRVDNEVKKTDDKEPSGTAGTPIWNVIERNNLNNILIVVVRYFGGTKLGSGPLLRAYANAANSLISNK